MKQERVFTVFLGSYFSRIYSHRTYLISDIWMCKMLPIKSLNFVIKSNSSWNSFSPDFPVYPLFTLPLAGGRRSCSVCINSSFLSGSSHLRHPLYGSSFPFPPSVNTVHKHTSKQYPRLSFYIRWYKKKKRTTAGEAVCKPQKGERWIRESCKANRARPWPHKDGEM